jgi:uncharacterized protein YuzE
MISEHNKRGKMIQEKITVEGEWDYDFSSDILFFKVKNREYSYSVELKSLVIDVDESSCICGLQIFNASRFFDVEKVALKQMSSWKLEASIEQNTIEVRLVFNVIQRNKTIEKNPILIQPLKREMPDSMLVCEG